MVNDLDLLQLQYESKEEKLIKIRNLLININSITKRSALNMNSSRGVFLRGKKIFFIRIIITEKK